MLQADSFKFNFMSLFLSLSVCTKSTVLKSKRSFYSFTVKFVLLLQIDMHVLYTVTIFVHFLVLINLKELNEDSNK